MGKAISYRMQIKWNIKTVEWFWRASEYTGFHKNLAGILLPMMPHSRSLCDLGCGAGLIDFALCKKIPEITCIDIEPGAVHFVQRRIQNKNITNMRALCEDMHRLSGVWDTVMMVFVGGGAFDIQKQLGLCRDKIILVDRGGCVHNPSVGEKAGRNRSFLPLIDRLWETDVRYRFSEYTLEYGQPFADRKEIYEYVSFYHKNPYHTNINEYIEKNIVETGEKQYPFYLPYQKHFGVFEISKKENRHLLERNGE